MGNQEQGLIPADQQLFQQFQRLRIQVIGRLIEHQHIGRLEKEAGQEQAVAFAAGKHPGRHAHAVGAEQEVCQVAVDVAVAPLETHGLRNAGHIFRHRLVQIDLIPQLIQIDYLQICARAHNAGLWLKLTQQQLEQGGLATPVRTQNPDLVPAINLGGKIAHHRLGHFGVREGNPLRPQNPLTRYGAFLDFHLRLPRTFPATGPLAAQLEQGPHPSLVARATGFDSLTQPHFLLGQLLVERLPLHGLGFEQVGFTLQKRIVVAGPAKQSPPVQFDNPRGQAAEKSPVVGDKKQTHRMPAEKILQPENGAQVQVVCRLIQQEQIRLSGQCPGEQDAAFQAAGKRAERGLRGQFHFGQQFLQPHVDLPILLVARRRNSAAHDRKNRSLHSLRNFLIEPRHDRARRAENFPGTRAFLAGDEPHEAGLPTAIASEQGDAIARLNREVGPLKEVVAPVVERDGFQLQQSHGRATLPQSGPGATTKSAEPGQKGWEKQVISQLQADGFGNPLTTEHFRAFLRHGLLNPVSCPCSGGSIEARRKGFFPSGHENQRCFQYLPGAGRAAQRHAFCGHDFSRLLAHDRRAGEAVGGCLRCVLRPSRARFGWLISASRRNSGPC